MEFTDSVCLIVWTFSGRDFPNRTTPPTFINEGTKNFGNNNETDPKAKIGFFASMFVRLVETFTT